MVALGWEHRDRSVGMVTSLHVGEGWDHLFFLSLWFFLTIYLFLFQAFIEKK